MTDALLADLRSDEGFRAFSYPDHLGYETIGYGFLIDQRKGVGIPRPVAEFWLRYSVNECLAELQRRWPPFEQQPEDVQRALGNLAYNIGAAGVAGFKKMLAALERGDRAEAKRELLSSRYATQVPKRAARVAELLGGQP